MADQGDVLRIKVQGEVFEMDFDRLTWGEMAELEDLLGGSVEEANLATAKGVLALAFICVRRSRPAVTMDSLKALPMGEIELVEDDGVVPTEAVEDDGEAGISGPQL